MKRQLSNLLVVALEPSLPYELGGLLPEPTQLIPHTFAAWLISPKRTAPPPPNSQKFLDHSGIVQNFLLGSLARLQLARADAISGDTAKAKAPYQDFLTLWEDADPTSPS
jgi:hypothetical protein